MAAIAGKDGLLKIGTDTMTEVTNWSLDSSADMLDTTALGDSWKKNIVGLKEWKASVDANWSMGDTAQVAVQNAYLNSTSVSVKLYVNATNYYSGTAYINSLSIEDPVDGIVTCKMELTGTGAVAYN